MFMVMMKLLIIIIIISKKLQIKGIALIEMFNLQVSVLSLVLEVILFVMLL